MALITAFDPFALLGYDVGNMPLQSLRTRSDHYSNLASSEQSTYVDNFERKLGDGNGLQTNKSEEAFGSSPALTNAKTMEVLDDFSMILCTDDDN